MLNMLYTFLWRRQTILDRVLKRYKSTLAQYSEFNNAVSEAEKIVGYPTSFLNLRWLLTDELANIALHLRRLIGTDHPLLHTVRKLFINNTVPSWGLVVLLISKVAGLNSDFTENECDVTPGVLHSQRALAEVTEMIRTSNFIHKSVLNSNADFKTNQDLNFGNKITLLSGDYLLSKCFHELACLRNHDVNELMSSALRDLVDADFIGACNCQDIPFPSKPNEIIPHITILDHFDTKPYNIKEVIGNPYSEWTLRNILGGASLLGKSCQAALNMAHHSQEIQKLGYLFGKNIALAWQAQREQEAFVPGSSGTFDLVSAPVMIHLQSNSNFYEKLEKSANNVQNIDYEDLRNDIQKSGTLEKTKVLQKELASNAVNILNKFPSSPASDALKNIICIM